MRIKPITNDKYKIWVSTANLFAQSVIPIDKAVMEFNSLPSLKRKRIRMAIKEYDDIRRDLIPKDISADEYRKAFMFCTFTDLNIVAAEYDTCPLVVALCLDAPCRDDERVVVKKI